MPTNSIQRYANKEEIDQAYHVAYGFLDLVEALREGPSLAMDLDSSYSMLSEFILDFLMNAQALQDAWESLNLQLELIGENRRFAHAALLPFFDESKDPIRSEFYVLSLKVCFWCRELLYRIRNWTSPFDKQAMTDATNGIPGRSFGIEFVGDPYQDPEKWPQLFSDATLFEDKFDPRLWDLLKEMEATAEEDRICRINGEYIEDSKRLRQRCELEHSQLLRDLPFLPVDRTDPTTTPKETRGRKTDPQREQKRNDLSYLRSEYFKWQNKQRESTSRRKFNPHDWFADFDRWKKRARDIFDRYSSEYGESLPDAEKLEKLLDRARERPSK